MPFCSAYVKYTACVPLTKQTPGGDWDNHTLPAKDAWIQQQTSLIALERIRHEMNETLQDLEVNEKGEEGGVYPRFWNEDEEDPRGEMHRAKRGGTPITDCESEFNGAPCWKISNEDFKTDSPHPPVLPVPHAASVSLRRFMCYLNFPRCDEEGRSLILCRSVCENYMTSCGYDKELWRCGNPQYLGAEKPEIPLQNDATGEYDITWRAPFPGAPFRDNEFDESDPENPFPIVVCTPSVMGAATARHGTTALAGAAMLSMVLILLFLSC
jgi:hypothetical protein